MADETIQPPQGANTPEVPPAINPPPADIKTYPTRDEVEKITREIAREEGFKIKDSLSANSITVLGIFASFITFLSVEIQILKTITNFWLLLGLSSFLLAGILVFCFSLTTLVKGKLEWKELNNPISAFVGIFIFISIISFYLYSNDIRIEKFPHDNFYPRNYLR